MKGYILVINTYFLYVYKSYFVFQSPYSVDADCNFCNRQCRRSQPIFLTIVLVHFVRLDVQKFEPNIDPARLFRDYDKEATVNLSLILSNYILILLTTSPFLS